jgi:hypothetical protein
VAVDASVGVTIAIGEAAVPQAERKKAKNKNKKRIDENLFSNTKGIKFHKGA